MTERFDLPAELTIYTVQATRDSMLAWVGQLQSNSEAVSVCGAAVQDVDGAGLQLLRALQRALDTKGLDVVLSQPSTILLNVARTLGWPMTAWSTPPKESCATGVLA